MNSPGVPDDIWLCGICHNGNLIETAPNICPTCSHIGEYGIGCCVNPGEHTWASKSAGGSQPYGRYVGYDDSEEFKNLEGYKQSSGDNIAQDTSNVYHTPELTSSLVHTLEDQSFSRAREKTLFDRSAPSRSPAPYFTGTQDRSRRQSNSSSSSYANSEFSIASLASSATNLSLHSTYATTDIAKATKELITILQDDDAFSALYVHAVADVNIGPEKLERNLRRFFKTYSDQLKSEAGDTLEFLASRLVGLKARAVASSILGKYNTINATSCSSGDLNPIQRDEQHSSDDEGEPQPVNEDLLQDLDTFRRFLIGGEAFKSLQKQVRSFVLPRSARQEAVEHSSEDVAANTPTVSMARNQDVNVMTPVVGGSKQINIDCHVPEAVAPRDDSSIGNSFLPHLVWESVKDLLDHMRFGERPIQAGFTRLQWRCACGHRMRGDVFEHREGGIAKTIERIRASTGSNIVATPSGRRPSTYAGTVSKTQWTQAIRQKLSAIWQRSLDQTPALPQHTRPSSTSASTSVDSAQSQQPNLLLMSCMKRGKYFRQLYQDGIDDVGTDQVLFRFMRKQVQQRQGRIRKIFSFESIRGISFVKFDLRASGYVAVQPHAAPSASAAQRTCNCIPPEHLVEPSPGAEYRCKPHGPPDVCPPFLSGELMHWLTSPKYIDPKATTVLDQLPKRTKGELKGLPGQSCEGWGINFQVGFELGFVIRMVIAVLLLASVLFGALWSYFKMDVQGAFGVSSYMATLTGLSVAWFAFQAQKME